MKTLFTILALSLCLGATGQTFDSTQLLFGIRKPDTVRKDGRMTVTYPAGYVEIDTMPVWLLVSNPQRMYPKTRIDSAVDATFPVVIGGFKLVERRVLMRTWEAGEFGPITFYQETPNTTYYHSISTLTYLYEDKREITGLIIWDTKNLTP